MMRSLPITPPLIARLAGYAQWLSHLATDNREWRSQGRQALAESLIDAQLLQRVAELIPQRKRDLAEIGLFTKPGVASVTIWWHDLLLCKP